MAVVLLNAHFITPYDIMPPRKFCLIFSYLGSYCPLLCTQFINSSRCKPFFLGFLLWSCEASLFIKVSGRQTFLPCLPSLAILFFLRLFLAHVSPLGTVGQMGRNCRPTQRRPVSIDERWAFTIQPVGAPIKRALFFSRNPLNISAIYRVWHAFVVE